MADFKLIDNSDKVLKAFQEQVGLGLQAIGAEAQGYAVRDCPVDIGRLRNSITWAVTDAQGDANTQPTIGTGENKKESKMAEPDDYSTHGTPEKNKMYLGTNVEYAAVQEYGDTIEHKNGKAHFLRDAISTHGDEYRAIMQAALQDKGN